MLLEIGSSAVHLGWPQFIYLTLTILGVAIVLRRHGQSRPGSYNILKTLIASVLTLMLLYWGGFLTVVPR